MGIAELGIAELGISELVGIGALSTCAKVLQQNPPGNASLLGTAASVINKTNCNDKFFHNVCEDSL